jgi:hypothetical protein
MKLDLDLWITNGTRYLHITGADDEWLYVDNHHGPPFCKVWRRGWISHEEAQRDYLTGESWFCESPLGGGKETG